MASSSAVIPISLEVQLDDLMKQVTSATGLTEDAVSRMLNEVVKTNKTATKAAKKAVDDLAKSTKQAVNEVGDASDDVGKRTGDAFGAVGSSASKLAGALDLVVPGLGSVARNIADVADVGEVAGAATQGLGRSIAGMGAELGLLGLALAPVIGLWVEYREAQADAARVSESARQIVMDQVGLQKQVKSALDAAMVAIGARTSAEQQAIDADNLWADRLEALNGPLEDQRVALLLATKQIDEKTAKTQLAHLSEEEYAKVLESGEGTLAYRIQQLDIVNASIAKNATLTETGLAADRRRIVATEANAEAAKVEAEALKAKAEAGKDALKVMVEIAAASQDYVDGLWDAYEAAIAAEKTIEELRRVVEQTQDEWARLSSSDSFVGKETIDRVKELVGQVNLLVPPVDALTDVDKLGLLYADLTYEASKSAEAAAALEEPIARAGAALAAAKAEASGLTGALTGATSALGAMSSADSALSALGSAGPWGAFIAGLISFIKDFDESLASFSDFHMDFSKTLGELPELLVEHLQDTLAESSVAALTAIPKFIETLAANIGPLIEALLRAIPEIIEGLIKHLVESDAWVGIGFKIAKSLILSLISMWQDFASGEMFDGIFDAIEGAWDIFTSGHFVSDIVEAFVAGAEAFIARLKGYFEGLQEEGGGKRAIKQAVEWRLGLLAEIATLGQAETQYGDSPGVVRAGPQGLRARLAPQDYVAAHRTMEGLQQMVGGPPAPSGPVVVNWADAHRSFDGFFVRQNRIGSRTAVQLARGVNTGRHTR